MVALALDIGETRIGIAVSSRDGKMAMPVKVLPAVEVTGMAKTFRYLVEDYEPDSLVSVRRSRRSAQLSLPRVRCSPPLVRPSLLSGRLSSLLLVRFSIRLLTRLSSPLLVRPSLQAAPALSSRHLPSERRPPNRIRITLVVRMALLRRPARATTRMLVAVLKRKAPRCL